MRSYWNHWVSAKFLPFLWSMAIDLISPNPVQLIPNKMSSIKPPPWLKLWCLLWHRRRTHALIQLLHLSSNASSGVGKSHDLITPWLVTANKYFYCKQYCCSHEMQLICAAKHLFSVSHRSISRNLVQCRLLLSHVWWWTNAHHQIILMK